jgi:putative ABC transport system substrate-binding protein
MLIFQRGLRDLGYVDGQTIRLEHRYAEGRPDRLPPLAAELARLAPEVLWTHSDAAAQAAARATTTIPIVVGLAIDLVQLGLVKSVARPGGNLTGLDMRPSELAGKRLELFKAAVPSISRVAVLVDPSYAVHAGLPKVIEPEARALGVQLQRVEAGSLGAFEAAFAAMVRGRANGLMIMESALLGTHREQIATLALRHRLPAMGFGRHYAEAGALLAYGAGVREMCERSAVLVHRILNGARPADLPVEQPTTFPLVVNLKTAKALGLTISPSFLARAEEVVE